MNLTEIKAILDVVDRGLEDPELVAQLDKLRKKIVRTLATSLRLYYEELIASGFDDHEAFQILIASLGKMPTVRGK